MTTTYDPADRYAPDTGRVLLSGIQALVRLPLDQHRADTARGLSTATFITGYEGSPIGGYDLQLLRLGRLLDDHGVRFVPGVNEELAATSIWGTQTIPQMRTDLDGVIGFWYGKAPGVDRAGDAMRHGNYAGTHPNGGVVVLAGDDPASKSSTVPSASEGTLADRGIPVLAPADVQDVLDLGRHAIALSRYSGLWVGMKIATDIADAFEDCAIDLDRVDPILPDEVDGVPWHREAPPTLMTPGGSVEREASAFGERRRAVLAYLAANRLDRVVVESSRARLGIVAAGVPYQAMRESLRLLGLDDTTLAGLGVRVMRLAAISPIEPGGITSFAEGLDEILVIEEKRPFVETQLRDILYNIERRPAITGALDPSGNPLIPIDGELTVARVLPALRKRLAAHGIEADAPARTIIALDDPPARRVPFFCSGCPHNRSTVTPDGSLIGGGIGCHAMVVFTDDERRRAASLTQMGGEGAQWIGQEPFSEATHLFQNLGDGTYFHSGSLAIRAAISSGSHVTYKLLVNDVVAMTGGQQPAGTRPTPEIARQLLAEGVDQVLVCSDDTSRHPADAWPAGVDVWTRDRLEEAQERLRSVPGVTVLIYEAPCATEIRRDRRRGRRPLPTTRVVIHELVCEGCGDCGVVSNCLSLHPVTTEFGPRTRVDQASCNLDMSCLEGDCPAFVTVEVDPDAVTASRSIVPPIEEIRDPEPPDLEDGYAILLAGIGGTGVLTANALLATAAFIDGHAVRGIDQTGLSQKAGPVVSHLRIVDGGTPKGAGRTPPARADLLLGFDALVAADPNLLTAAGRHRTVAVVSTATIPTGTMVAHRDRQMPDLTGAPDLVARATREIIRVDAHEIAERLAGDPATANVVLIGAAYQLGLLPLTKEAITAAIRANGVTVEANLTAFAWGRLVVEHPTSVSEASSPAPSRRVEPALAQHLENWIDTLDLTKDIRRVVTVRTSELVDYQDEGYATEYLAFVTRVVEVDRSLGKDRRLTDAVARNLFKLMAIKDEYEVARLLLDERFDVAAAVPGTRRATYHLHPPMLRAMGLDRKIRLTDRTVPALRALRSMRRVRGTPIDIFGRSRHRRLERSLIGEYTATVEGLLTDLSDANYERAVTIADLPDMIRGFDTVKEASIDRYEATLTELLGQIQDATPGT